MRKRLSRFFDYQALLNEAVAHLMDGWDVVKPIHAHWFYGYTIIIEKSPKEGLTNERD